MLFCIISIGATGLIIVILTVMGWASVLSGFSDGLDVFITIAATVVTGLIATCFVILLNIYNNNSLPEKPHIVTPCICQCTTE